MNAQTIRELTTGSTDILHTFPFTSHELVIMHSAVTARVDWLGREIAALPWDHRFLQTQKDLQALTSDARHLSYLLAEILKP